MNNNEQITYLACGCFWGVQHLFNQLKGVNDTEVGYMGGKAETAFYPQVKLGHTGHKEVVKIVYDTTKINYEEVLKFFFEIHDFTQKNGQGVDIGDQYKSVIYFLNSEQQAIALKLVNYLSLKHLDPPATQVIEASNFYTAEEYHQNYFINNPINSICHLHKSLEWAG